MIEELRRIGVSVYLHPSYILMVSDVTGQREVTRPRPNNTEFDVVVKEMAERFPEWTKAHDQPTGGTRPSNGS